jgi:hypothetical protein
VTIAYTTMKFDRYGRFESLVMTNRKVSAFARKQAKELARYPLFSDHVANEQPDIDTEIAGRIRYISRVEATMRSHLARTWRKSRARYFSLNEETKQKIREKWGTWTGPRTASYFASMVDVMSGDQASRLERCAQVQREYMARLPPDAFLTTGSLF